MGFQWRKLNRVRSDQRGLFLAEVLLSLVIVSTIVYVLFVVFETIKKRDFTKEKKLRAVYVARSKMEELLSKDFFALNDSVCGCENIDDFVGEEYLDGQVCVNIETISDWDAINDVDAKRLVVSVVYY